MTFAVWLIAAAIFYRAEWTHRFRIVLGDNHDTVHLTYLQQHWFEVLHGQSSWINPPFFYPLKGVLGWSESLFLFQIGFTPFRILGADMFLAAQLTVILLSLIGFVSFVVLARVAFRVQKWAALLAGLAFTFANDLWLHIYWLQLLTVWLVPGVLLLGVLAVKTWPTYRRGSFALAVLSGVLAGLTFYTSYYISWFTSVAIAVALLVLLVTGRRRIIVLVLAGIRERWRLVVAMGVAFIIGLIPFLETYLPAEGRVPSVPYRTVMLYAPKLHDVLNVGTDNVVWSSLIHRADPAVNYAPSWLTYAVTPVLMLLAVVGSAVAVWMSRGRSADSAPAVTAYAAGILGVTALVLTLLPVQFHVGSPWSVLWHIPGATVIRRTNRIGVVTGLVASLAAACAASEIFRLSGPRRGGAIGRVAVAALLVLAVVEQLNTTPMAGLDRVHFLAYLRAVPAPPPVCRSFYVLDTSNTAVSVSDPQARGIAVTDQLDAMLISEKYELPTVNGYTSYQPPGWGLLYPFNDHYRAAVRSWAEVHHLQSGLCQFDLATMQWQPETARGDPAG